MHDRAHDSRAFRILTLIDEYTRECLSIDVSRRTTSGSVLERLSGLFVRFGVVDYIRSDNGPECAAFRVREWAGTGQRKDTVHRARQSVRKRIHGMI